MPAQSEAVGASHRVEALTLDDVQISRVYVGIGAKYQSHHLLAGSLRSFPQDSWHC